MAGYTKLFSEIVTSTIWQEDDKTRIIWITMLALSNKYGEVSASVPGLAHTAHVKLTECEKALKKLEAPDRYSRSQEYDGRRIGRIDGGFKILNYGKYRERMRSEDRTEYLRIKQAELRARRKKQKCQQNQPESTDMQKAEAEAEAIEYSSLRNNVRKRTHSNLKVNGRIKYDSSFNAFWIIYPKKVGKGAAHKSWKKLKPSKELQQKILTAVEQQKKSIQWQKDDGQFVPNPATWLNQCRWDDTLPQKESNNEQMERIHKELLEEGKIKE